MPPIVPRATQPYTGRNRIARGAAAMALAVLAACLPARAFVFLDTSSPAGDTGSRADTVPRALPPPPADAASPAPGPARSRTEPPHYRAVLFLSADSKLVYAYIGVLKALEQYGLAPDAVLAESKAVAVGAAWALGYDAGAMESWFLAHPLEPLLRPFPAKRAVEERAYLPDGRDPPQWDLHLSVEAFQARSLKWNEVAGEDAGEYLHLSWAMARLTHDGPAGPVEDLKSAPRRLAVQVSDLNAAQEAVLTEGSLQTILKGSLLPAEVVRQRPRLWPCASGSLLSGHAVMSSKLPFACDRIILIEPGRRLRPPALQSEPLPWTDSLALRAKAMAVAQNAETSPNGLEARALRIELDPGPAFDPDETDPARWIELGYTSALRSMDVLKSAMSVASPAGNAAPAAGAPAAGEGSLSLNRLSVNPLAPGGHQLLLDILRVSEGREGDSSGEEAIEALTSSGYYSDLDVEWAKGNAEEKALLVFDARERSKLRFRAGWNALVAGDDMRERPPEVFGSLLWSEPFYVPIEAEAGAVLGGNRPGFSWRFAIAPIYPWPMRLGLGYAYTQADLGAPFQASAADPMGALSFPIRYRRHLLQGFLDLRPSPRFRSESILESDSVVVFHEISSPDDNAADSLKSIDFIENLGLGLGKADRNGNYPFSWKGRFRYAYPVVTSGIPRDPFSSSDSRLRLAWKDLRLIHQYYWSDQNVSPVSERDLFEGPAAFDLMQAGRIDAFSFQDDYFLRFLRSARFQDARAEYAPVWGHGGMKLSAGAWRNYGNAFFPEQRVRRTILGMRFPGRAHWEAQAGYATPFGSLRVGMGGLDGKRPFYYVRIGSDARLGFGEE